MPGKDGGLNPEMKEKIQINDALIRCEKIPRKPERCLMQKKTTTKKCKRHEEKDVIAKMKKNP